MKSMLFSTLVLVASGPIAFAHEIRSKIQKGKDTRLRYHQPRVQRPMDGSQRSSWRWRAQPAALSHNRSVNSRGRKCNRMSGQPVLTRRS